MAKNESPIIVGVFQNRAQAEQAYHELDSAGFGKDYLGFAEPSSGSKGLLDQFKNVGVPDEEARFYADEYAKGHTLVTIRAGGLADSSIQKAIDILKKNGAYDASSRDSSKEDLGSKVSRSAEKPFFDTTP